MNETTKQPEVSVPVDQAPSNGPSDSASDILRQWQEMTGNRDAEIERRKDNWMLPPIGIEEAVQMTRSDVNALMWFVDKTLKLLAARENDPNDQAHRQPPSETLKAPKP